MTGPSVCAAIPPPSFSHRSIQRWIEHLILFAAASSVVYSAIAPIFLAANSRTAAPRLKQCDGLCMCMLTMVSFMSVFLVFMSVFLVEFSVVKAACTLRWASVDSAEEDGFLFLKRFFGTP
jgi:hypothetical protein